MNVNQQLRDALVQQSVTSFVFINGQIDALFGAVGFFIDRYDDTTIGQMRRSRELYETVAAISELDNRVAARIAEWKTGLPLKGAHEFEQEVLVELASNVHALVFMLVSNDICIEPFTVDSFNSALSVMFRCNRVLT